MIRSTLPPTSHDSIHEDLAGVRWSGNVRPVDQATEKAVLDAHQKAARGEHREPEADTPGPAELKPTRRDVEHMTEKALRILQLFASGMGHGAIARAIGVHRVQLVRFREWLMLYHRLDVQHVEEVQAVLATHGVEVPEFVDRRCRQPGRRSRKGGVS